MTTLVWPRREGTALYTSLRLQRTFPLKMLQQWSRCFSLVFLSTRTWSWASVCTILWHIKWKSAADSIWFHTSFDYSRWESSNIRKCRWKDEILLRRFRKIRYSKDHIFRYAIVGDCNPKSSLECRLKHFMSVYQMPHTAYLRFRLVRARRKTGWIDYVNQDHPRKLSKPGINYV